MNNIESKLRFSVIIPLEFHRGQVEACLRKWIQEQSYPRAQYEIVAVGCSHSLDEVTISMFKSLLSDYDRLLLYHEPHDMALCAYGAKQAKGELLFFTESHCLPEPNILSIADQAFNKHPDWEGFSCQSIRITPNRLSIIEADMYEADIRYGMQEHPWRKILDQCFAVRAKAYYDAGGFRPELGHFAEWHLAAQMHQKGYQIGYVPEAQVHHYYIGDINELIEFSRDFSHGEMTYHSTFINDECWSYFIEPPEWLKFHLWDSHLINTASQLAYNAYSKPLRKRLSPREIFLRCKLLFRLRFPLEALIKLALISTFFNFQFKRLLLILLLHFWPGKSLLHTIFIQLNDATIRHERIRFIQNFSNKQMPNDTLHEPKPVSSLNWIPDTSRLYPSFGFHVAEEWQGKKFIWSEPVGIIKILLIPGNYHLEIKWLPIKLVTNLMLYINEKPIPTIRKETTLSMAFQVTSAAPTYFALTCEPWAGRNDPRLLGIPVTSIYIKPQ